MILTLLVPQARPRSGLPKPRLTSASSIYRRCRKRGWGVQSPSTGYESLKSSSCKDGLSHMASIRNLPTHGAALGKRRFQRWIQRRIKRGWGDVDQLTTTTSITKTAPTITINNNHRHQNHNDIDRQDHQLNQDRKTTTITARCSIEKPSHETRISIYRLNSLLRTNMTETQLLHHQ